MGVIDNELNWRKAFADSGKDVSGWTLAQRMSLPDWCFGNRQIVSKYNFNAGVGTNKWNISAVALPDPCCIWNVSFLGAPITGGKGYMRIGLADAVPTSEEEMDAAMEIFPNYGTTVNVPKQIPFQATTFVFWSFDARKGMVTGAKKLVTELHCDIATIRAEVILVISSLPTAVPAFLNPEIP